MGACLGKLTQKEEATKEKAAEAAAPMTKTILITGASGNIGKATIAVSSQWDFELLVSSLFRHGRGCFL